MLIMRVKNLLNKQLCLIRFLMIFNNKKRAIPQMYRAAYSCRVWYIHKSDIQIGRFGEPLAQRANTAALRGVVARCIKV